MSTFLEITNLSKYFGGVKAIDNFSVKLQEGQIHGLIGPNGAGKTTIFNTITGIYQPTSGSVTFRGRDITGLKPFQVAQNGVGRTFQNIRLFSKLSVLENVVIASHMEAKYNLISAITRWGGYKKIEKELMYKATEILKIVGLGGREKEIAGSLPYGHQRKLEIARALALSPTLLLLDEPAAGMNSEESEELVKFLGEIHSRFHLTILMIEHHMDVVMNLCHTITVLNFGKTLGEGTPAEIQANPVIIEAYLGGEDEHAQNC